MLTNGLKKIYNIDNMDKIKEFAKEHNFLTEIYFATYSRRYIDLKNIAERKNVNSMLIPLLIRKGIIEEREKNEFQWSNTKIKPTYELASSLAKELSYINNDTKKTRKRNITFNEFVDKPYKRKHLRTNKIVPYDDAKEAIKHLGIVNSTHFREIAKNNNLPDGVPKMPHITYKSKGQWKGWKDFLGLDKLVRQKSTKGGDNDDITKLLNNTIRDHIKSCKKDIRRYKDLISKKEAELEILNNKLK